MSLRCYSWDPVKLANHLSMEELNELRQSVENDPAHKNRDTGSIWLYNRKGRRKLDAISWAITYLLAERKQCPEDTASLD